MSPSILPKNGDLLLTAIGLIGDIHAEPQRLETSLRILTQMNLDAILCTGDIVDGCGDVDICVRLLQVYQVKTVFGNHDAWFLKDSMRILPEATKKADVNENTWCFLNGLPLELEFETTNGRVLLCHGLGKHLMAKVGEDDYGYALDNNFELQDLIEARRWRFVVNGHTHRRMTRNFNGLTIINAGTLLYENACFQVVDFSRGVLKIYSADNPEPSSLLDIVIT